MGLGGASLNWQHAGADLEGNHGRDGQPKLLKLRKGHSKLPSTLFQCAQVLHSHLLNLHNPLSWGSESSAGPICQFIDRWSRSLTELFN